ncbi:MAG: hypothetical protein AAGM36_18560 [Cyanobacteria bacterium J06597_1]
MSVDYSLFRSSKELLDVPCDRRISELDEQTILPFGSQHDLIECLCSIPKFFENNWQPKRTLKCKQYSPSSSIDYVYEYHQSGCNGRMVTYVLRDDPVIEFSINRAFPEDFLPLVHALEDLGPFLVFDPQLGKLMSPSDLNYAIDEWLKKNYQEKELESKYV